MRNVGFIGVGYMGYGVAKNILKHKHQLFVIANKNRKPIDKVVSEGAKEVKSFEEFKEKNLDAMFMCVTNTPIAISIAEKISSILNSNTLIIDVTTHKSEGSIEVAKIFNKNNIQYVECPVMGGPVQAEEGILGGIVGASLENFKKAEPYVKTFCKNYFHFGDVGMGAKTKLLNNFLTLGNGAFIVHMINNAQKFGVDLNKLFEVAKLGSGNSAALNRIFDGLLKGDYTGFKFTANNSHKDLSYIEEMLKNSPESAKLAEAAKDFFKSEIDKGKGDLFISELINKKN